MSVLKGQGKGAHPIKRPREVAPSWEGLLLQSSERWGLPGISLPSPAPIFWSRRLETLAEACRARWLWLGLKCGCLS